MGAGLNIRPDPIFLHFFRRQMETPDKGAVESETARVSAFSLFAATANFIQHTSSRTRPFRSTPAPYFAGLASNPDSSSSMTGVSLVDVLAHLFSARPPEWLYVARAIVSSEY
ncbi:MAG: hypothetical protein AB1584_02515 [Pseudomonadota bacterium]